MTSIPQGAVITADIVGSQSLSQLQLTRLQSELKDYLAEIATAEQGYYSFYRGDGFQLVLPDATKLFNVALQLRLFLISRHSDARLSLAIGEVNITAADLSTATGAALVLAGRGLDAIGQARLKHNNDSNAHFALNLAFVDLLLSSLTQKQAEAAFIHISHPKLSHADIAKQLNTSRVNVTKLLNSAHYTLLDQFLAIARSHQ